MKNNKPIIFFLFMLCFIASGYISAQMSYGGKPLAFEEAYNIQNPARQSSQANVIIVPDLNRSQIQQELEELNNSICVDCNSRAFYGKEVDVNINFFEKAGSFQTEDSIRVWTLQLSSGEAEGFQLIFNRFRLTENSRMFVYNEDRSMILGAFTSENNRECNTFITQNINGNSICIEYSHPSGSEESEIVLEKVVYIFSKCFKGPFSQDGAASCQINTSCMGDEYDIEIKSSVMILEKPLGSNSYWGICSGTLINDGTNYVTNGNPYILSSNHCYETVLENVKDNPLFNDTVFANPRNWLFLFRHEATSCQDNGSAISNSTTNSVLGAQVKMRDEKSKGADYLLLQIYNRVSELAKFDIAFAGYDYNYSEPVLVPGSPGYPVAAVHHPKGDVKKISISEKKAESIGWNNDTGDDHWKVTFTTGFQCEPGSSGSGLFNNRHQIIGICHGGKDISCNDDKDKRQTVYGKLSDAHKNNNIQAFLFKPSAPPYIPDITELKPNMSITIYGEGEAGKESQLKCRITCPRIIVNGNYVSERAIIRVHFNKLPYDYTRYDARYEEDNSNYYYVYNENFTIGQLVGTNQYEGTCEFTIPPLYEEGEYKGDMEVYLWSENYANVYKKDFVYNITSNAICECGEASIEIENPMPKYAPGSTISFIETAKVLNNYYDPPFTQYDSIPSEGHPCYRIYTTTFGYDQIIPRNVGIERMSVIINQDTIFKTHFDTAEEYINNIGYSYYKKRGIQSLFFFTWYILYSNNI